MQRNTVSREILTDIITARKLSLFAASCEGIVGLIGATATAVEAHLGSYGLAATSAIPTAYLFCDYVFTMRSFGERPFHLTQTLIEKLSGSTKPVVNLKASDFEKTVIGEAEEYSELQRGIAQEGDTFYVDCRMPGVVEEARITRTDDKGFTYQFDWGGVCAHFYGLNDGGILKKKSPNGRPEFFREAACLV